MEMRTPTFHFDYTRKKFPEGALLYELVRSRHAPLSLAELADGVCDQFLDRLDGTSRMLNYLMMLYDRFGQNSYVIGPKVQDLFRRTDLSMVLPDMVREPQTGFYLALPDCPLKIWGGQRTQWHSLSGAYVGFTRSAVERDGPRQRMVHFALWGAANERSLVHTDDAVLWYSMSLDEWDKSGDSLETFFRNQAVMLNREEDASAWGGFDPLDPTDREGLVPSKPNVKQHQESLMEVMRIIFNLCLYLDSDEPDLEVLDARDEADKLKQEIKRKKPGGKRKKLERRLENLARTRVVYVGPMFEGLTRSGARGGGTPHGTHASPVEHAVRPHWQRYWVGSGDERRQRWKLKGMYVRGSGQPVRTITKVMG